MGDPTYNLANFCESNMNKSSKDNTIGGTSNKPLQQASIGAEIVNDNRTTPLGVLIRNAQQNLNKEVESIQVTKVADDSVHSDDRRLPNKALFRVLRTNPSKSGEVRPTQIKRGEIISLPLSEEEGLCSQEVKTICDKAGVDLINDLEIRAIYNDQDEWYNLSTDQLEEIKTAHDVDVLPLNQTEVSNVRQHKLHPKQSGDIRCVQRIVSDKKKQNKPRKVTHNIVGLPKKQNVENVLGTVPFYNRFNLQNVMFGKSSIMVDLDYLYSRRCEDGYGIYDCLSACPKEILYMEPMQRLGKRFGVKVPIIYKHMLEVFIERILYSYKYHYYVLMTCLRNKDQGLRDILRKVIGKNFEKLNSIKKRSYWEEVLFFAVTHYRAMFKSILPVSPIEQEMWKKFSTVTLPSVAQGFSLSDFKKHVVSKLIGISTTGNFALEVINDVTSFMQSITDWILSSIGIQKDSHTNLSKFLRIFVVVLVGGLIIQTGYTIVKVVWKVMAALMALTVGTTATVMLDLVDQTEYCEAQGNDHVIATLLNFGAIAAVGSRMPLSGKLSAARTGAPLVEQLWDYIKPFLNFCSKKILGYEYFIGEEEVPELRKFSGELIDLLAIPDLGKRCVVDSNLMRKVQDMYFRSVPMRKVLLKTDCYDGPARTAISINMAKLDSLFASTLACSSLVMNRPTPIMVYLMGEPGQGKTTMLDMLASGVHSYIMEARKRKPQLDQVLKDNIHFMNEYESWCKYPRVIGSDYWEGYSGQWMVQYNEIFGSDQPLINSTTSLELLSAIESCAFPLNRAFEEKGKSYFTSDIVIATSNIDEFANIGLKEKGAFIRRLHCPIVVKRGEELKSDLSNLNKAWSLSVKLWDHVKGGTEAQNLGLLDELKVRKHITFGIVDLIHIVGNEMINRYTNPTISQRASKMPWSEVFKKTSNDNFNTEGYVEQKYGVSIDPAPILDCSGLSSLVELDNGAGIGFCVDQSIEAQGFEFESSSSSEEEDDEPQSKEGWVRYTSRMFGSVFKRSSESNEDDNDGIDDISTAIGSMFNFRKAEKKSQSISIAKKHELADWFNHEEPDVFDRLCFDYLRRRERWHRSINEAKRGGVKFRNKLISSSDFGYVRGINVFNNAVFHFGTPEDIDTHIYFSEDSKVYHIYTHHEMSQDNIEYDKFYNVWFSRALRLICTMDQIPIVITLLGIGTIGASLCYFGLKKLCKYVVTPTLEGNLKKVKTLTLAQSPKKEKLAMATRYKVAPRIVRGEQPHSHAQGQPVGDVEFAARCANILGNLRWVRLAGNRKVWTQGLFGTPMCLAVPLHAWYNAQAPTIVEIQDEEGKTSTIYNRSQFDIVIPEQRDIIFVHFKPRVMPMSGVRDISRSIPEQPYGFVEHPIRLMRVLDEKKDRYANVFFSGKDIKFESAIRHNVLNDEVSIKMKGYYVMTGGGGTQGLCASPVVTRDITLQNAPLLGMHIGRYGEDSIVAPLYKDDFHILDKEHTAFSLISTAQGLNFKELFTEELSSDYPNGTSPYFRPKYPSFMMEKTELSKSAIFDYLPPPEVAPAMLRKTGSIDPLDKAKAKYAEHSASDMNRYTSSLFNENFHYLAMFNRRSVGSDYAQLSFQEAVFGTEDGVIEPMEKNTSSGYPDVCKGENPKRRNWIDDPIQLQRLEKRSDDQIRELSAGMYSPQVVIDQLKDELRSLDRVQQGKTRLFCVGSITDCITAKRVLGRYLASQKKHLYYSAACIGHNPHDIGWGLLYERIERWPANKRSRWFGGDAGGFDYSIKRWEVELAFHYIYRTLPVSHQDVAFWKLVKGILYRVCTTIHVSRDSSYICEFRNSSGNWLTAWLNSFVMFSRIMACFLKRKPDDVYYEKYEDLPISLVVYGDDNLGSVREDVDWFDNVTLAQDMMQLFQCQFTDPNKGEIKDRFLDLPSQIFLSRSFEVDGYHRVRAPLHISSIMGMLYYVRGNTREEKLSRLKQNIVTAMQELCHYDLDRQKETVLLIQEACAKANIEWDFDDPLEWSVRRSERSTDTFYFDH